MRMGLVLLVPFVVLLPVPALVDHLGGDVDGRKRREDEGLQEAREDREGQHRHLDRDELRVAQPHQLLDDVVLADHRVTGHVHERDEAGPGADAHRAVDDDARPNLDVLGQLVSIGPVSLVRQATQTA